MPSDLISRSAATSAIGAPATPQAPESEGGYHRVRDSDVFRTYRTAFEEATGMPLWIEEPSGDGHGAPLGALDCPSDKLNPFCRKVFWNDHPCEACVEAHSLLAAAPGEKASTIHCFAGLRVTAVPVWLGRRVLGYLRTGQVFARPPDPDHFAVAAAVLQQDPLIRDRDLDVLRELFMKGPIVDDQRYTGVVQLLVFFAEQLSLHAERMGRDGSTEWPDPVKKAAEFIRRNFEQSVTLDELARVAAISAHHLCALFKESTGVTMIEFLNRERILQAKKRLRSRYARVSEVALDVGFGSLSQFNRCFAKYAGESPTEFRRRVQGGGG